MSVVDLSGCDFNFSTHGSFWGTVRPTIPNDARHAMAGSGGGFSSACFQPVLDLGMLGFVFC